MLQKFKQLFYPLLATVLLAMPFSSEAQSLSVNLDTTALMSGTTGPYYIEFQFIDGDGANNNYAYLGNFDFGGGSAMGSPTLGGGVMGSLGSGITMLDTGFFNFFYEEFTPGNFLSFIVTLTDNYFAPNIPDQFSFAILNGALNEVPTQGPGNELISVDLGSSLVLSTYSGISGSGGDPVLNGSLDVVFVPEPATILLLIFPFMGVILKEFFHARNKLF